VLEVARNGGQLEGWNGRAAEQAIGFGITVIPLHLVFGVPLGLVIFTIARRLQFSRLALVVVASTVGAFAEVLLILLPSLNTLLQVAIEFVAGQPMWITFSILAPHRTNRHSAPAAHCE
jgi:hypothetical protein